MEIKYKDYSIDPNNDKIKKVNIQDVYLDNFDITWATYDLYSHSENLITEKDFEHKIAPRTWDVLPQESFECDHKKCDSSIIYKYNNEYFRSDDFTNQHDGLHILFAGCSETEGVGGSLESTWSKQVYNEISKSNKMSGFYSIARAGYGWQKIITNFQVYVKKYNFPQFFFVMLPNVGRQYKYDIFSKTYRYFQLYPEQYEIDDNGLCTFDNGQQLSAINAYKNNTILLEDYYKSLIDFKISWQLFEEYCKLNGTTVLWSTYDTYDTNNFEQLNISNNFFPINSEAIQEYLHSRSEIPTNKDAFRYRDGHFGTLFKEYWAQEFIKIIKERNLLSL